MIHKTSSILGSLDTSQLQNGVTHESDQTVLLERPQPRADEVASLESFAGSFADDPLWDELMAAIEEDRRKMDAQYDKPE